MEVENKEKDEPNIKEDRIRQITLSYYSRKDVQEAILKFCENRETVPRYFEGFGKRPDYLQYPQDLLSLVKKGATSFHCSEELWRDPLQISTELGEQELKDLRIGWDLLIDIDCKYLEYSKKAAYSIIQALKFHNIHSIGVKFSGGKGFHIIVPSKAFPKEFQGQETRSMFPEWPRLICSYLTEVARPILEKEMESEESKFLEKLEKGIRCEKCKKISQKVERVSLKCPICKRQETSEIIEDKKRKCPDCRHEMIELERKPYYKCPDCSVNSLHYPENFQEGKVSIDLFKVLEIDVILVSPRHLFRAPYSLHEKTSLVSIVIDKDKVIEFMPKDADYLKVKPINFLPEAKEGEARELLIQALDWQKQKTRKEESKEKREYKEIVIKDLSPEFYPPCIKKLLEGMEDGKKRALFILINFFRSLNLSNEEIEKRIEEWNSKNKKQLKQGYIKAQLSWYERQKKMLPPNCDKLYYKDLAICSPDALCKHIKNPINYTIIKSKSFSQDYKPKKNAGKLSKPKPE